MKSDKQDASVSLISFLAFFSFLFITIEGMTNPLEMSKFSVTYGQYLKANFESQKKSFEELIRTNDELVLAINNTKAEIDSNNRTHQLAMDKATAYLADFSKNWEKFTSDIKIQKKKYFIKLLSPERNYINCLSNAADLHDHNAIQLCQHKISKVKDKDILALDTFYNSQLSLSQNDMELKKKNTATEYIKMNSNLHRNLFQFERQVLEDDLIKAEKDKLQKSLSELNEFTNFMDKHSSMLFCNNTTPTINMEKSVLVENGSNAPGYLYQSPRDDQILFQTGTCYSHVTKDMLTAVLKGKNSPSFLDLANIYSKKVGRTDNLDGGDPCQILDAVYENGYCPYQFSAFEYFNAHAIKKPELARATYDVQNLWNKINLLSSLINKDNIHFYNTEVIENFDSLVQNSKEQLTNLNMFRGIPSELFPTGKQGEYFRTNNAAAKLKDLESFKYDISVWVATANTYLATNFLDKITSTCSGDYSEQECSQLTNEIYEYLIQDLKHYIQTKFKHINEDFFNFHRSIKDSVYAAIRHPHYQQQLKTIAHLLSSSSIHDTIQSANEKPENLSIYFLSLEILNISNEIDKKSGIDFRPILKFMSANSNPMQQMLSGITPACNNPKLRREIPKNLKCESSYNPTRLNKIPELQAFGHELFRYTILKNLLAKNSVPVGNVISVPEGLHIHSIVGMRFDVASNQCQYLIRDSNGARSDWTNEKDVIESSSSFKIIKPEFHEY